MNVLYLHSHDTGRFVEPYGQPVRTPALMRLARRGTVFRRAFAVASSCSASRASLQTGQYPHQNGMTGLAHRGWRLFDYDRHVVNVLRPAGYRSALIGEHHVAPDSSMIGYDEVVLDASHRASDVARAACEWLAARPAEPWLMSCGFWETHRTSFEPVDDDASRYVRPLPTFPDRADLRRDAAALIAAAARMDAGIGEVLGGLERSGAAGRTVVVATTDHAPGFPGWKANVTDRGLGVYLILAGPGIAAGGVNDALVSHLDVLPTLTELAGLPDPPWAEGASLWPLLRGETDTLHDALFAEANFHAALEPQRAIRTDRFRYVRRFDDRREPVLANVDDGPTKDWVLREQPALIAQKHGGCSTSRAIHSKPATPSPPPSTSPLRANSTSASCSGWRRPTTRSSAANSPRFPRRWPATRMRSRRVVSCVRPVGTRPPCEASRASAAPASRANRTLPLRSGCASTPSTGMRASLPVRRCRRMIRIVQSERSTTTWSSRPIIHS